jgi:hypothetical protein
MTYVLLTCLCERGEIVVIVVDVDTEEIVAV